MDDRTIITSFKKGFKLSSFRVQSLQGTEFEYIIQNINDIMLPQQLSDTLAQEKIQDAKNAANSRFVMYYF